MLKKSTVFEGSTMKLLYIITKGEVGGAQKYVQILASYLSTNGVYVTVVCGNGVWLRENLSKEVEFIHVPQLTRIKDRSLIVTLFDIGCLIKLYFLIRKRKFDIIHTNSTKAGFIGRIAAKLAKTPCVIHTIHGSPLLEELGILRLCLLKAAERIVANWTDAFIAVSHSDRTSYCALGIYPQKIFDVIHNGVSVQYLKIDKQVLKQKMELSPGSKIVGTISNLYPTKGIQYLILASVQIIAKYPEVTFIIVGDGPQRDYLKMLGKRIGLTTDKIVFTGYQKDINEYLSIFDIFILSSIKEGCPFALLEAMAFGLPVVATRVGGVEEIIEHNKSGLLIPPKSETALATAIDELLLDKAKRVELGENARTRVNELFNESTMVYHTINLYKRIKKLPSIN